jgi:hypothetical protein
MVGERAPEKQPEKPEREEWYFRQWQCVRVVRREADMVGDGVPRLLPEDLARDGRDAEDVGADEEEEGERE